MTLRQKSKPTGYRYRPPTNLRGIFAGCGSLLNHPQMGPHVLRLAGKASNPQDQDVTLVYLGTASYDLPDKRENQTSWYSEQGCNVIALDVVSNAPETSYMKECMEKADVILVSGGNTSFAVRRWKRLGLDAMMREACLGPRRVVMAGGSAGAICWWSGGHSDSIDPDSYKDAKLNSSHSSSHGDIDDEDEDPSAHPSEMKEDSEHKEWDYIRVDGLGFIPGLCCPHHDRVQSNGILRAHDFDDMLLRHPTEVGVCIDHNAAFSIEGNEFRVLYPEGKEGSVMPDETFSEERLGRPGVWIKEVLMNGKMLSCWLCPAKGKLSDLLKMPEEINPSVRHMKVAAAENPDDGPMRMSYPGFKAKSFFGGKVAEEMRKFFDSSLSEKSDEDAGEKSDEEGKV